MKPILILAVLLAISGGCNQHINQPGTADRIEAIDTSRPNDAEAWNAAQALGIADALAGKPHRENHHWWLQEQYHYTRGFQQTIESQDSVPFDVRNTAFEPGKTSFHWGDDVALKDGFYCGLRGVVVGVDRDDRYTVDTYHSFSVQKSRRYDHITRYDAPKLIRVPAEALQRITDSE